MCFQHIFVEFNSKPRAFRRDDESVFEHQRLFKDHLVYRSLVCFLYHEVRRARVDLDGRRGRNRTAIHVRCDNRVVCFRHAGYLLRLGNPAALTDIELDSQIRAGWDIWCELLDDLLSTGGMLPSRELAGRVVGFFEDGYWRAEDARVEALRRQMASQQLRRCGVMDQSRGIL